MHALQAVMGQGGGLALHVGIEEVLVVALAAGEVCRVDAVKIRAHAVDQIGVGHHQVHLALLVQGAVGVAVEAADGLGGHGLPRLGKVLGVGGVALLQHHGGVERGLAGPAAGLGMGAGGFLDVLNVKHVAPGRLVVKGEAVVVVQRGQHGVIRQVIGLPGVLLVLLPGAVLVGIGLRPVGGGDDPDMSPALRLQGLHIGLLGDELGLDGIGAEGLGVDAGLSGLLAGHGADHGVLDGGGADGGAGHGVHLSHVLGLEHGRRQLLDSLGADALGLRLLGHGNAVDLFAVRNDLHRHGAVAPVGGAGERRGGLGDLAVLHAGHGGGVAGNDAEDGQHHQQDAAGDADAVVALLFLLFLIHVILPEARPDPLSRSGGFFLRKTPIRSPGEAEGISVCLYILTNYAGNSKGFFVILSFPAGLRYRPRTCCPAGS